MRVLVSVLRFMFIAFICLTSFAPGGVWWPELKYKVIPISISTDMAHGLDDCWKTLWFQERESS